MPTKWLQERQDGSKNDVGITPRIAFSGWQGRDGAEVVAVFGAARGVYLIGNVF
jgi:hypothetical protein